MRTFSALTLAATMTLAASAPAQEFFVNKAPVTGLVAGAWSPTLNTAETEMVFSSNTTGNYELYTTTRPDVNAAWATPVLLAQLNTTSNEYEPNISSNGLELHYVSTAGGSSNVMLATRTSNAPGTAWSAGTALPAPVNPAGAGNDDVALTDDGLTMYLSEGGDIQMFTRASLGGAWGNKMSHPSANTLGANEHSPITYHNGHILVFASTVSGGTGSADFYITHKDASGTWSAPTEVKSMNLPSWDSNGYWGRTTGRMYWSDWAAGGPRIQCADFSSFSFEVINSLVTQQSTFTEPYWPAAVGFTTRMDWVRGQTSKVRISGGSRTINLTFLGVSPLANTLPGVTIPGIMVGGIQLFNGVYVLQPLPSGSLDIPIPASTPLGLLYMQAFGVDAAGNKIYTSNVVEADVK